MARASSNLASMTAETLLRLREEVGQVLKQKAQELTKQLDQIEMSTSIDRAKGQRGHPRKGVKVPPKYRGPSGELWAGRGAQPKWLVALLQQGRNIDEFLIASPASAAGSRERSAKKKSPRKRTRARSARKRTAAKKSARRRTAAKKSARKRK